MATTVKSGEELRTASAQKAATISNNSGAATANKGSGSPSYQNTSYSSKKTVKSGDELRATSNARAAQLQKASESGTFNPGNTRNVGVTNYYNTHSEEDYVKQNNKLIQSDYVKRITAYANSGKTSRATTGDYLRQAIRYADMTNDEGLKKSWDDMIGAVKGQYLYDYTNEHRQISSQLATLQSETDAQRQTRQNASDSIVLGLYYDGDPQKVYNEANAKIKQNTPVLADLQGRLGQMEAEAEGLFMTTEIKDAMDRLSKTANPTQMLKVYSELGAKDSHEAAEMRKADQQAADDFRVLLSQPKKFYSTGDIIANVEFGWAQKTAASFANLESLAARSIGTIDVVHSAADEQALLNGETVETTTPDWAKKIGEHGERVNEWARSVNTESQERVAQAKASASKFGQFGIDVAMTALDVAFDAATGLGLAGMGARVIGQSALEAQEKGATLNQQILYGAANAAVEILTEKLSGGLGLVYGKGFSSDIVEDAIGKLAKTTAGANWLRFFFESSGEGMEEVISDLMAPFLNWIIDEKARNEHLYDIDASEVLYDYLLGAAIGSFGQVTERATGAYAQKNEELGLARGGIPTYPTDNTAGKQGYINRYTGSETDMISRQDSPTRGSGEQIAGDGDLVLETEDGRKIVAKENPNEAPGIKESTPEEKQANRELGRKAEWLVKESQNMSRMLSLGRALPDYKARLAEAYEAATGEKLGRNWNQQLKAFAKAQQGKREVGKTAEEATKTETPSEKLTNAPQAKEESKATEIPPAPAKEVKQTPTPATEANAATPAPVVDNKPKEVHNEPVAKEAIETAANTGVDSLMELYRKNPQAVADYYKEITGYDLSDPDIDGEQMVRDDLQELHTRSLTLPETEVKSEEPAIEKQGQEEEPVKPSEENKTPEEPKQKPQQPASEENPDEETAKEKTEKQKEADKKKARKTITDKVKKWLKNQDGNVLDAETVQLAREHGIDVYEIWNDDNTKLIGYGVDDDTFTVKEKPAKKEKPKSKREQLQDELAERDITAQNIAGKIKSHEIEADDIEQAVAAGLISKTAVKETLGAKSYAVAVDLYRNPVVEMTAEDFTEKVKSMTWDDIKKAKSRGELSDEVFETVTGIKWSDHKASEKFSKWKQVPTTAEERAEKKAEKEVDKDGNPTDRAKIRDKNTPWDEIIRIRMKHRLNQKSYRLVFDAIDPESRRNADYYDEAGNYAGSEEITPEDISEVIIDEASKLLGLDDISDKNKQIAVERELLRLRAIAEGKKNKSAVFEANKEFVKLINSRLDSLNSAETTVDDVIKSLAVALRIGAIKQGGDPAYNSLEARYAFEELTGIHVPMDVKNVEDVIDFLADYEDQISKFMQDRLLSKMKAEQAQKAKDKAELAKLMADQKKDGIRELKVGEAGAQQKGAKTNVRTELRKANRGRVLGGSEARVEFAFGEAGRRGLAGTSEHAFRRWRDYTRKYEREGAVRLNANQLNPETAGMVNELLDSGVSFVTVMDASKMKKSPGLFGFVINKAEGAGVFLFVNDPAFEGNSVPKGIVVLHEPVHYFSGLFASRNKNKSRPNYTKALGDVGSAIGVHPYRLISLEQRFSGRDMWIEAGVETLKDDAEWKKFRSMSIADQNTYLKEYLDDDVRKFVFAKLCEEAAANIAAKNPSLDFNGSRIDMEKAAKAMRKYLYDNHIVPRGLFERLEPYAEALNNQASTWEEKTGALETTPDQMALKVEPVEESTEAEATEENYEPEYRTQPKIPSYMQEVGEEETDPTYAPSREHTMAPRMTSGQKKQYGSAQHEVISKAEVNETAFHYVREATRSKKRFQEAMTWLEFRSNTGAMNIHEEAMAQILFADVSDAISSIVAGKQPRNKAFRDFSVEDLSSAEKILKDAVAGTKSPAAQVLSFKADIPDTQTVRINARRSFFKNLEWGEVDKDSVDTKLERIVEDYTYHIEKLDAEETHDVQKMLKLAKDIAHVRNVSSVFGAGRKTAQNMENWILDFIAKSDPNAYDTIRKFALGSVNRISSDFQTVGTAGAVAQIRYLNMLSNFATCVSNIGNNDISIFNEANSQNIGRLLLGKYFADVTGEEQIGKDYTNSFGKGNFKAMELGAAEGLLSLYYGLEVDDTTNGKADYDVGAKFNQNTKVFGSAAFGKFLARMTMLSGIKMQVTDAAAKARTLHGLNVGVDKMKISEERKTLMYTDNKKAADYRLFHEDTPINQAIGTIRKRLDSKLRLGNDDIGYLGLGTLMMPFVKVPINVATHALRATPVGSFVGLAHVGRGMIKANRMHSKVLANNIAAEDISDPAKWAKAKKQLDWNTMKVLEQYRGDASAPTPFNKAVRLAGFEGASEMSQQESAEIIRTAGRVVTNTGLTLLGVLATGMGAIKDFDQEDDDDMARLAKEHGLTGLQLNLSAILEGRRNEWDFDNDLIIGGSWLEIASIPFIAGAEIWNDAMEAGEGKKLQSVLASAALSPVTSLVNVANILKDMPGLQQLSNIYEAIENSSRYNTGDFSDKMADSVIQYGANQVASFVIPNSLAQFSAGYDNTVRDVYNTDNPWKTAANIIVNKTPFRNRIPERITSAGDVRKYDDTRMRAIINKTILPGDFHRVTYSDIEKEWLAMARAGATNVMPPASAPKKIQLNGEDYVLDAKERQEWLRTTTTETAALQSMIKGSPYWDDLSPDLQKKAFQDARKTSEHLATFAVKGTEAGLDKEEYFDKWELNNDGQTGIAEFLPTKYYLKSLYNKDKTVADYDALDNFIRHDYNGLSENNKELLDNSYSWLDSMADAYEKSKMTSKEFYDAKAIYKKYNDQDGYKGPEDIVNMHSEFAKLFGEGSKKAKYAEDNMVIFNQTPGDTRTKDKIIGAGYSLDVARQYINFNADSPDMPGYDQIQDHQKYNNVTKIKFSDNPEENKAKQWEYFFDVVIPETYTGQRRKLAKCMNSGDTLEEALAKVKDSEGNPLNTVYAKDADGNKYVP